jgi:histidinol-phosphate aminotransferase
LTSPFNVNAVALACLEAALEDQDFVREYVAQVKHGREQIANACHELGLRCWPSFANFVLVRVGKSTGWFVEAMQRRGIMVRDSSANPGCAGCVRITVPTAQQLNGVLQAIRESVKELPS